MRTRSSSALPWIGFIAIAVLILDGKTTVNAANEAIVLCIQVLIPALFPFLVFSPLLCSGAFGIVLRPVTALLRLSDGCESILLTSFLGGYPAGAVAIAQSYQRGQIDRKTAERMMAFGNNPGPSFLFGIGLGLFQSAGICWLVWGIVIASSIVIGFFTPGNKTDFHAAEKNNPSIQDALKKAIIVMSTICGWVILFRILIVILDRWILWLLPPWFGLILSGILELANGCTALAGIENTGLKMTLFCAFLCFGGICVWMQTSAVARNICLKLYMPGKMAQTVLAILFCQAAQFLLPRDDRFFLPLPLLVFFGAVFVMYPLMLQKVEKRGRNFCRLGV